MQAAVLRRRIRTHELCERRGLVDVLGSPSLIIHTVSVGRKAALNLNSELYSLRRFVLTQPCAVGGTLKIQ